MSADLTSKEAKKMGEADLAEHMTLYGPHSSAWYVAFNERQRRHARTLRIQTGLISFVVYILSHSVAKLLGL